MKNITYDQGGLTNTKTSVVVAAATDNPDPGTNSKDIHQGSIIKAVWIVMDLCGLAATGVNNVCAAYLMKNPGDNLVPPTPSTEGTSNEKKFIFKEWSGMCMRNQDGNAPLHWEGWVKIPKRYQRFGLDDTLNIVLACVTSTLTGHFSIQTIYKYYW